MLPERFCADSGIWYGWNRYIFFTLILMELCMWWMMRKCIRLYSSCGSADEEGALSANGRIPFEKGKMPPWTVPRETSRKKQFTKEVGRGIWKIMEEKKSLRKGFSAKGFVPIVVSVRHRHNHLVRLPVFCNGRNHGEWCSFKRA